VSPLNCRKVELLDAEGMEGPQLSQRDMAG
jgi:hypothetical protein